MQQVKSVRELLTGELIDGYPEYIDGYVSTDEFMDLLHDADSNYEFVRCEPPFPPETFFARYYDLDLDFERIVHPSKGLTIDYVEIPIEEALQMREAIGFMAMSRVRVHFRSERAVSAVDDSILKVLSQERQNVALLNHAHSKSYIALSEFYR